MDWLPVVSAVAACLAVLQAWQSRRVAKEALRLALEQDARRQPSVEVYLANAHIQPLADGQGRLYVFQLWISNNSDSPNAVTSITMVVEQSGGHHPPAHVAVSHDATLVARCKGPNIEALNVPVNLTAKGAVRGAALFRLPDGLVQSNLIQGYAVVLRDVGGYEATAEAILLMETPP